MYNPSILVPNAMGLLPNAIVAPYICSVFNNFLHLQLEWKPSNNWGTSRLSLSPLILDVHCRPYKVGICSHATMVTILPAFDGLLSVWCLSLSIVNPTFRIMYELMQRKSLQVFLNCLITVPVCVCVFDSSGLFCLEEVSWKSSRREFNKNKKNLWGTSKSLNRNENKNLYLSSTKSSKFWGASKPLVDSIDMFSMCFFSPKAAGFPSQKTAFPMARSVSPARHRVAARRESGPVGIHTPPMPPPSRNKALHGPSLNKAQPLLTPKCC